MQFMLPNLNLEVDYYDILKLPLYISLYLAKAINSLTSEFFDVTKVVLLNLSRSLLSEILPLLHHKFYL